MMGLELEQNILSFTHEFGVVQIDQIKRFFHDQDKYRVSYTLQKLLNEKQLFEIRPGYVSTVRENRLPYDFSAYSDTIVAIHILCDFLSSEISYYGSTVNPSNVVFMTIDNDIYDVTVFPPDKREWYSVLTMALAIRKESIPDGMPDVTNHIGVVQKNSDFSVLAKFGFGILATVDENGHVAFYRPETAGS